VEREGVLEREGVADGVRRGMMGCRRTGVVSATGGGVFDLGRGGGGREMIGVSAVDSGVRSDEGIWGAGGCCGGLKGDMREPEPGVPGWSPYNSRMLHVVEADADPDGERMGDFAIGEGADGTKPPSEVPDSQILHKRRFTSVLKSGPELLKTGRNDRFSSSLVCRAAKRDGSCGGFMASLEPSARILSVFSTSLSTGERMGDRAIWSPFA